MPTSHLMGTHEINEAKRLPSSSEHASTTDSIAIINDDIVTLSVLGTNGEQLEKLAVSGVTSARSPEGGEAKSDFPLAAGRLNTVCIANGESIESSTCRKCCCFPSVIIAAQLVLDAVNQSREMTNEDRKGSCFATSCTLIYVYIIRIPFELWRYFSVRASMTKVVVIFIIDIWDTVTDVFLLIEFMDKGREVVGWLSVALFLGAWNLLYEAITISRGTAYVTDQQFGLLYEHELRGRGNPDINDGFHLFTSAMLSISRNISEDGLVMIVGLLRGQQIVDPIERIAYGTTLGLVALSILQQIRAIAPTISSLYEFFRDNPCACSPSFFLSAFSKIVFTSPTMLGSSVVVVLWGHFLALFFRDAEYEGWERDLLHTAGAVIVLASVMSLFWMQTTVSADRDEIGTTLAGFGPFGDGISAEYAASMRKSAGLRLKDRIVRNLTTGFKCC
eukprot:jgi/Bigna1/84420/fgenesh1_pg.136_\